MWREGKVKFYRYQKGGEEEEEEEDDDEDDVGNQDKGVFNLFVLHQNRDVGRGSKNCVQETLIPEFCDLVVWGHEHECQIELSESLVGTFRISQPGSSVATSLVAGEAVRKKVGILDIKNKLYRIHPVPLTQVRSFVMSDINLREHRANLDPEDSKVTQKVTKVLEEQIKAIIFDAMEERTQIVKEAEAAGSNAADEDSPLKNRLLNPEKVLVRLRVEHTGFHTISNQRFGAKFVEEIANSDNILLFRREKQAKKIESKATRKTREALKKPLDPEELERTNMEDLVSTILDLPGSKLELLQEKALGEALEEYVEKNNLQAISNASEYLLKKRQKKLISQKDVADNAEDIKEAILRESFGDPAAASEDPMETTSNGTKSTTKSRSKKKFISSQEDEEDMMNNDEEDEENMGNKRIRSSSSSSSRKAKAPAASRRKHRPPPSDDEDDDDDDVVVVDEEEAIPKTTSRASRRGARKVNYSMDNDDGDDDDDGSDAVVDLEDAEDDDEVMEIEPPKKGRKATLARTTSRSTKSTAKKTPPRRTTKATSTRKARRTEFMVDSDNDDDDHQPSIGLADDWGSAATNSQYKR